MTDAPIAVYGASGHTGSLVAAELAGRGTELVLGGRSLAALEDLRDRLDGPARIRIADVDDAGALRKLAGDAAVVVNCAGPFAATGTAIASAAIDTGSHYLDHSAEPLYVREIFDVIGPLAEEAGVTVVPGMSCFGALADLLAERIAGGLPHVETVTVAYAVRGWRMTAASKATALGLSGSDRVLFVDGALHVGPARSDVTTFEFPDPVGIRPVLPDYPAGEVVTIPRHVATRNVRAFMTAETFASGDVFDSDHIAPEERAGSSFLLAVRAETPDEAVTGHLSGLDIYRTGAVVAAEAAVRLADSAGPGVGGVRSAAEVFPASDLLTATVGDEHS
jgi:hypothetical protein